jgi:hypothetical protein
VDHSSFKPFKPFTQFAVTILCTSKDVLVTVSLYNSSINFQLFVRIQHAAVASFWFVFIFGRPYQIVRKWTVDGVRSMWEENGNACNQDLLLDTIFF